jgi:predicted DNA-binding transcriptional regulator YafY
MPRGDQLSRQWRIIQALIASRRGKSVPELAAMVDCHTRTVYRDLEALQAAGFPVTTERQGHRMVWSLLDAARRPLPIPLSLSEIMALYFGRRLAEVWRGTDFHEALASLFDKIRALLPAEMIRELDRAEAALAVRPSPVKRHAAYRDRLEAVRRAIFERRCLEMTYRARAGGSPTRRRVAPYRLMYFDGSFYLIGFCRLRSDLRVFALDRIRRLETTDEPFEPPAELALEELLKSSFGVFHGPAETVRVRFSAEAADLIQEKEWHASQRLEREADGGLRFTAEVAVTEEIKRWILGWGAKAEVLAPPRLRADIRRECRQMARRYRGAGGAPADTEASAGQDGGVGLPRRRPRA